MSVDNWQKLTKYALVIKTNQYAGNFEREMCSYLTGFEGEYYPGGIQHLVNDAHQAYLKLALAEGEENVGDEEEPEAHYFVVEYLKFIAGEHGDHCVTMALNDEGDYHNVAIFFDDQPPDDYYNLMISRIKDFPAAYAKDSYRSNSQLQILGAEWHGYKTVVKKVIEQLSL